MGDIYDRLTISLEEVKTKLRLNPSFTGIDSLLTDAIAEVKTMADDYCQREFVDEVGDPVPIPPPVKGWCLSMIERNFTMSSNGVQEAELKELGRIIWTEIDYTRLEPYRFEHF